MRASLQRVKTLEAKLIGLEMELKLMINDLAIIKYNITQLVQMEKRLVYNINFLKKDKVIATASEYKKSVEELGAARESLQTYYDLEKAFISRIEEAEKLYSEFMEEYERAKGKLENEKVILLFDPKKRKKKKNERSRDSEEEDK